MSQQINLILPELKPRFDPFALPVVLAASGLGLVIMTVWSIYAGTVAGRLTVEKAALDGERQRLQQQVQSLGLALSGRKPNPALEQEIRERREDLRQREEALQVVENGRVGSQSGFSRFLYGFGQQVTDGVWLVGFAVKGEEVEIRGRLTDPGRLPVYIRKLNAEPVFQGRRFAALDMKDVQPKAAGEASKAAPAPATADAAPYPYTEFVLRANLESRAAAGAKP